MTEYVFVDPGRLRRLANALRDAAEALRDETPTITSRISGWGGTFDGKPLTSLAEWLDDEWGPMLNRADLAATYKYDPVITTPGNEQAYWRSVPWDIDDAILAEEGRKDAWNFAKHADTDDPERLAQVQREAAEAMEAHADDPAYLEAFFAHGGADVLDTFNKQLIAEGVPLSGEAQEYLGWYATGVAAATKYHEEGEINLSDSSMASLLDPDNTLSTGLMMNYGPAGDEYGSQFLADAAEAALEWRASNEPPRPHYSEPMTTGAGYVSGGWVQSDDAWWAELGINISYLTNNHEDASEGIGLMREYDPVSAILSRTGENDQASRLLLTGENGLENAQALIDYDWQTAGPMNHDDSGPAASVLQAAALDRGEDHGELSAEAAANIFQAGYDLSQRERSDYDREQLPDVPPSLAQAMSVVASAYAPDMARSTGQPDVDVHTTLFEDGAYVLQTNTAIMNGYMSVFMTDPQAAGAFRGAIQGQLQGAAQILSEHPDESDMLTQFGYLNGMVSIVFANQEFSEAEMQDAANEQARTYFDITSGIVGAIPLGSEPIEFARSLAELAGGVAMDSLFPTDAAAQVDRDTQYHMRADIADMRTHVAQGFVNSGAYPLPEDASFVHSGVISPRNAEEQAAFDYWWSQLPEPLADLAGNAPDGFRDATMRFAPDDHRFNEPE
ncbi:hypothetical protein [Phytoactinopolyspora mesophila]|uniref:Uncharacterized protein n=1 Tax=Phytoactinopolyspora mesophila TaxID=2650750 RepID=A0A7K3MA95_9ACTN|nr:hypothetical protein [Phytoactinopolyspora mesophila]NDL59937.1 hypothetical protein [Phytoactinopolyspora mesophila]